MASTLEIFFCYAREDEKLRNRLEKQLRALKRQGIIDLWHDREISAGAEWKHEIDKHLNSAQIILLLVSPDFMDSDYSYSIEMKRAMERHERGEARVIPVILRPVYWQGAPFGKLQALPTGAKPVISRYWHNLDEAFFDVSEGIRIAIKKLMPSLEASAEIKQSKEIEPFQVALQTSQPATLPDNVQKTKEQWLEEGKRFFDLKRYEEALAAYEQTIRLDTNDAAAYRNKGNALNRLERYEEALAAYEQAIRLDPNDALSYRNKGNALNRLKRYEEALAACEQAIRLDPNYATAYNHKGDVLNKLNRKEEAQQAYEQARQLGYSA